MAASQSPKSTSRTRDDVARVVHKNKGRFYALYARALRDDPSLQGTIVFSIAIAPDGTVTQCAVASSTLGDPELEQRMVELFSSINFGAKGTRVYVSEYPMPFVSVSGSAKSPSKRLQPAREDTRSD